MNDGFWDHYKGLSWLLVICSVHLMADNFGVFFHQWNIDLNWRFLIPGLKLTAWDYIKPLFATPFKGIRVITLEEKEFN